MTCAICPVDDATPHGRAASGWTTVDVGAAGALDEPADPVDEGIAVDSSDESNDGSEEFRFECEHAVDNKPTAPSVAAATVSRREGPIRRISDRV